jgi:excisionase family DNA binding protein
MDLQEIVSALVERVARLEAARPKRRVFNQQEAAQELGLSVNTFRAEMQAGRIRGKLVGRRWLFTDEELQKYVRGGDPPP